MDRVPQRAMRWWRGLDDQARQQASWMALIIAVYIIHYLVYCIPQPFFIEDAAISFAYARNLIEGEGLVTYPGGERVEGYSNALWTFLLALLYALGVPIWTSAKVLGALLGALTLPLVYDLTRRLRPDAAPGFALLAPLALALHTPFVVWNASGLENALFSFLLAAGAWRLLREGEEPALRPLSAVLFFLLTMTRPEGVMYAAIGAFAQTLFSIADRRPLRLLVWLLVLAVPWGLYNAWRYWYFAWPFPNTYYAKISSTSPKFKPYSWAAGGWKYTRNYLVQHGLVFGLPLLFFALSGTHQLWRRRLSVVLIGVLGTLILWGGDLPHRPAFLPEGLPWPDPPDLWRRITAEWIRIRVWSIAGVSVLLGVLTLTWAGWRARGMLWACCASGVFFALYSGGDWMQEWRWFNVVSVTLLPLLAAGLGAVVDVLVTPGASLPLPRTGHRLPVRGLVFVAVFLPFSIKEVERSWGFANGPETSVRDIHRRVWYMTEVQRKLDIDTVTLLDVDMGAHMYFSGWQIVDIAGLVDVPMGHNQDFNAKFIDDYVFEQRVPDFAHVHGGWARTSKIDRRREWKQHYLEIPGYPIGGRRFHIGNHVRRDLFIETFRGLPAEGLVLFAEDVQLLSHRVPSPLVAAGGRVFIETLWRADKRKDGFRALFWLDDGAGHRSVVAVEPGYGWYPPQDWKATEQVHTRVWLPLPDDLPPGDYHLGVVLIDEASGEVLAHRPTARPEASEEEAAASVVYLPGEARLGTNIRIGSPDEAEQAAAVDLQAARQAAQEGRCAEAWPAFKDAWRHQSGAEAWRADQEPAMRTAIAACYLKIAAEQTAREERTAALKSARQWDHRLEGLSAQSRPLAQEYVVEGDAHAAQGHWVDAHKAYEEALALDPTLSWVRRRAEEARDHRLGLFEAEDAREKPEAAGEGERAKLPPLRTPQKPPGLGPIAPEGPEGEGPERAVEGAPTEEGAAEPGGALREAGGGI